MQQYFWSYNMDTHWKRAHGSQQMPPELLKEITLTEPEQMGLQKLKVSKLSTRKHESRDERAAEAKRARMLDYIDSLKKQDNKIGDISLMIDDLAKRMDYIDGVEIRFPDAQYSEFLTIRNWPRTFKQYIEERRQALLAQKDELYKEMSKEIAEVFDKIAGFKETIAEVLIQGLLEQELSYDAEDDESFDSMASGDKKAAALTAEEEEAKRLEQQRRAESADGKTFSWLAKEITMEHMKFDIEHVEK
jgi:hypothetical protein